MVKSAEHVLDVEADCKPYTFTFTILSGGIAVLIKKSVSNFVKIEKMSEYAIWLRVLQKHQPEMYLGGTYIPPQGSTSYLNSTHIDIYSELQNDLSKFLHITPSVALCGDFNSKTLPVKL
jgi:exonuclease III